MVYSQDLIMYERLSLYLDDLVELVSTLLHQFMDIVLFHLILGYPIISKWNGLGPNTLVQELSLILN
jgi:hypothetical protein